MYVINGGDRPSQKFHDFVDLCCRGFNIIRKHGNLLLNLFALVSIYLQSVDRQYNISITATIDGSEILTLLFLPLILSSSFRWPRPASRA